jgi:hypothetical protein
MALGFLCHASRWSSHCCTSLPRRHEQGHGLGRRGDGRANQARSF